MVKEIFMSFEDAVFFSERLIDFFNSPSSDPVLLMLGNQWNLQLKPDHTIMVDSIEKDCPECMGCNDKGCILGCYIEHRIINKICFWETALKEVVGSRLITHEFGHVLFSQAYETSHFSDSEDFETSEKFASFVENNFELDFGFDPDGFEEPKLRVYNFETQDRFFDGLIFGAGLGISVTIVGAILTHARKAF